MRQNVTIALLSVIATLMAVVVFSPPSSVSGQQAGGGTATLGSNVAVATGSLPGATGSAFWLYLPGEKKLAVYVMGNTTLELRAVRDVQYDIQAIDMAVQQGKSTGKTLPPVSEIKKALKKEGGKGKDE